MALNRHEPYPGVALVETPSGSVLLGAPTDSFKATKAYCEKHNIAFPRVLVAPGDPLFGAASQFNPEFFLYDFLFVYGAAFKPELAGEKMSIVVTGGETQREYDALRMTLVGPDRQEMTGFAKSKGGLFTTKDATFLADVSEDMAIKNKDGAAKTVEEMLESVEFDSDGEAVVLGGDVTIKRDGPRAFDIKCKGDHLHVALEGDPSILTPFNTLPPSNRPEQPLDFGVKVLGCRSGFDLSGPTTGFLFWINGRLVVFDGPVGTRYLLEQHGLSFEDIDAVVLSHCHEDHMGAFLEYVLSPQCPPIYTSEPIYRSALIKLSNYFRKSPEDVASFVNYRPLKVDVPTSIAGAEFTFFYTVHAIPTLGMDVRYTARGTTHRVHISGDAMNHDGLDKMHERGVIDDAMVSRMKGLIPAKRDENSIFFTDVGEAIIHGHPKDWQGNPNQVLYYHCPDNDHTRGFGHDLAELGKTYEMVPARKMHPAVPGRLLSALSGLEIDDPRWFAQLLAQGHVAQYEKDSEIAANVNQRMILLINGRVSIRNKKGAQVGSLLPGETFGARSDEPDFVAVAEGPVETFEFRAELFEDYIETHGLSGQLKRVWDHRPQVKRSPLFRTLDATEVNALARSASRETYKRGDAIVTQGESSDDFFVLLDGEVDVDKSGTIVGRISAGDSVNHFGEIAAINQTKARNATIRARGAVKILRIRGAKLRQLYTENMDVRLNLSSTIHERQTPEQHAR